VKKIAFFSFIIGVSLALSSASATAVSLDFVPNLPGVIVGETFDVQIVASSLINGATPSLGTYDIDVFFNPLVLTFNSVIFGDQLDPSGLGSIRNATPGLGRVNLFELSLDSPLDLDTLQTGSFPIATLTFTTVTIGVSSLELGINSLGDSLGNPLIASVGSGSVTVTPEPSTILLLGLGVGVGMVLRRKAFSYIRVAPRSY
jgi:hypothetical protein